MSSLHYKTVAGNQKIHSGGHLGMGLSCFLSRNFALVTGAEVDVYNGNLGLSNFTNSYATYKTSPNQSNAMIYTYTLNGYNEHQRAVYLDIPLMLQFENNYTNAWYISGGLKIALPLSATYRASPFFLTTKGYFPLEDRTYDDLPQYGFGVYENQSVQGKSWKLKPTCLLAFETGIKWPLSNGNNLYTGLFADIGLTNIAAGTNNPLVEYKGSDANNPGLIGLHSVLDAQINNQPFTQKAFPIALGIKIKYALHRATQTPRYMRCYK